MKTEEKSSVFDDSSAFRREVRLAAVQVAGLRPEELEVALAYEVEPFSGIAAAEAEVAFRPVVDPDPAVRVFEVAVRRRTRGKAGSVPGAEKLLKPLVVLGAVVMLAAVIDGIWLYSAESSLKREVAERSPLDAQLQRLRNEVRQTRDEAAAVRTARENAVAAQNRVDALRSAHAEALTEIAGAFGAKAALRSISSGEQAFTLKVAAAAVDARTAADVMRELSSRLKTKGWRLDEGAISASENGSTVNFEFGLGRMRDER